MNKTSEVVRQLKRLGECAYLIDRKSYPLHPILLKYEKMEQALEKIRDGHEENLPQPKPWEIFFEADEALLFDPLQ